MKPSLLVSFAIFATLAVPFPAKAWLGGNTQSAQSDRVFMRGTLKSTAGENYSVQEIRAANGVIVREYVSPSGRVFGVSWQGPTRPNLRQVLGPYYDIYNKAVQAQRAKRFIRYVRGPAQTEENGLVVEMGGHMRWYLGRAYVQELIPPGVTVKEIQ